MLKEQLKQQIEQEAEHYASVQIGDKAKFIGHHDSRRWDDAKEDWEAGAEKYAVAHALSMQPRFGGHLPVFYSVAQHCVQVCWSVWNEIRLAALLHDASEAYLIDVPRPVKDQLPNYKEIEERLMCVIAGKFGFDWPMHESIKSADEMALRNEWDCLMLGNGSMPVWSQDKAKAEFMVAYHKLTFNPNTNDKAI